MAEFDTIIRGGTVIDGTRLPRYRADVGIKDGKIAKLGLHLRRQAIHVGAAERYSQWPIGCLEVTLGWRAYHAHLHLVPLPRRVGVTARG